jgi:GNAT superfamily N-acetyltransferase
VWIAEQDRRPAGCVMCVRDDAPGTARLRLLLVEPEARGHGVGDRLVRAVIDFARGAGYRDLVLWTNDVLAGARRLYQRHGFTLVSEKPHHSFGRDLVGQDWRLPLDEDAGT